MVADVLLVLILLALWGWSALLTWRVQMLEAHLGIGAVKAEHPEYGEGDGDE